MLFFCLFFCRYFYNSLFRLQELTWVETLVKILQFFRFPPSPKALSLHCLFTCPLLYPVYFSPKNAWSYFKKKNWYRFFWSFHVSCTFRFRMAHGNRRTWALLSCSVYFVRIPLPFELIFLQQCNKIYRLTSKRLLFWCYSPCPEDSEKDCCSNKIKTCYYLLHMQALKKALDWWSGLFLLYNSSQCLAICNVLALTTTSCSLQYGYEIFMLVRKCYCDN